MFDQRAVDATHGAPHGARQLVPGGQSARGPKADDLQDGQQRDRDRGPPKTPALTKEGDRSPLRPCRVVHARHCSGGATGARRRTAVWAVRADLTQVVSASDGSTSSGAHLSFSRASASRLRRFRLIARQSLAAKGREEGNLSHRTKVIQQVHR